MPLAEKAMIAEIRRLATPGNRTSTAARSVLKGIGDDCAVLRFASGRDTLVTTDFTLEGVHFRRDWHCPESVGHRCLARGLSDIAAMGGEPEAAFLSLALPRDLPHAWVRRFLRSLVDLGEKYGVQLAGGDTAESQDGILADITVVGSVPKGKSVLRSGARPGDAIYVSGELGASAGVLVEMRARPSRKLNPRHYLRHFYPEPRVELGKTLREKGWANAMIDLSDGLSTDLAHVCEESRVGADISAELIPRGRIGKPAGEVDLELALHGGEDYELLFTTPPGKRLPRRIAGVAITQIGVITRSNPGGVVLLDQGVYRQLAPRGWEHFRK